MANYTTNAPPPAYQPQSAYVPPMHQFVPAPEVHKIRDWLPWSIVSLFIGWGFGGVLPLVFSLICRSRKRTNDVQGARSMSTLALVFNIIITIGGIAGWIGFAIAMVFYFRTLNQVLSTYP
jgi:hypothetical protein